MKKRIGTYSALCGVLSSSLVMFGMNNSTPCNTPNIPVVQVNNNNLVNVSVVQPQVAQNVNPTLPHRHDLSKLQKKLLDDFEKAEATVHPIAEKIFDEIKQEEQLIITALTLMGMKQQDAQNAAAAIEKSAVVSEKVDTAVYGLVQQLEAQQTAKNSDQSVQATVATKK